MTRVTTDQPAGAALNAYLLTITADIPGQLPSDTAARLDTITDRVFDLPERARFTFRFGRRHGRWFQQAERN